ncbi:MAG: NADH-quinone oxidoreductase subunit N [Gemmataceae bacterium]
MSQSIFEALRNFFPQLLPEVILALTACVLFLGATFRVRRGVWGTTAVAALLAAGAVLWYVAITTPTLDALRLDRATLPVEEQAAATERIEATVYAAPVVFSKMAIFFKAAAILTGLALVLLGWNEAGDEHAGEYHGCLLLMVVGMGVVGSANDLATMYLALELISIPTYVLLYLPRVEDRTQEAAMKYFMLSIFSSGLLLFGLSYLYGLTGTTNIPAILDALHWSQRSASGPLPWLSVALLAYVMVVAGLGFRITAVPFHFYAPDVYQGTSTPTAALLSLVPKIVGFAALIRLLGLAPEHAGEEIISRLTQQVSMLLWIMSAVTMTLGNILALLQNNIRRLLAYSSISNAGYMLIGLSVVPHLGTGPGEAIGGIEALLFYLVAYGAMTVGFFAVIHALSTEARPLETVDDLAGLGKTHPGAALLLALFLFSLIGMPLTAGFAGKFMLFFNALGLPAGRSEAWLYRLLAIIAALNAAVAGWYYLRMIATMYLREAIDPFPKLRPAPLYGTIALCAVMTLGLGVYPNALLQVIRKAVPGRSGVAVAPAPAADREVAARE